MTPQHLFTWSFPSGSLNYPSTNRNESTSTESHFKRERKKRDTKPNSLLLNPIHEFLFLSTAENQSPKWMPIYSILIDVLDDLRVKLHRFKIRPKTQVAFKNWGSAQFMWSPSMISCSQCSFCSGLVCWLVKISLDLTQRLCVPEMHFILAT